MKFSLSVVLLLAPTAFAGNCKEVCPSVKYDGEHKCWILGSPFGNDGKDEALEVTNEILVKICDDPRASLNFELFNQTCLFCQDDNCDSYIPFANINNCGSLCKKDSNNNYFCTTGFCVCNNFGFLCYPSGGCTGRRLGLEKEEGECDDYNKYMSLTEQEKEELLGKAYCEGAGNRQRSSIENQLEALADTNGNGELTCEEFNSAYQDVSQLDLCIGQEKFDLNVKGVKGLVKGLKGSRASMNRKRRGKGPSN